MASRPPRSFARRGGRPLRPGRRAAFEAHRQRFELPAAALTAPLDPATLFVSRPRQIPRQIWLEIGFGAGEHLAAQARANPQVGLIGAEPFETGAARLIAELGAEGADNVRLLIGDARDLLAVLPAGVLDRVFVLFPDPWPKRRHHKRRLINRAVLDQLARTMAPGAELRLATDHGDYARWMLRHLLDHPDFVWLARRPADWRRPTADWPPTRYQAKAERAGRQPVFLRWQRR